MNNDPHKGWGYFAVVNDNEWNSKSKAMIN